MPRIINFEGRRISVPDDATPDEIIDILTRETAPLLAAALPEVSSAERRPELALRTAQSAPSRSGMFDDLIPAQSKPGMCDDLIPPPPPGFVLDQPTSASPAGRAPKAVTDPALIAQLEGRTDPATGLPPGFVIQHPSYPPLPPGFVLDKPAQSSPKLIPVDHDPFAQYADAPKQATPKLVPVDHDPWAQFPDAPPAQPHAATPAAAVPITPGGVPLGQNGRPRIEINTALKPIERPAPSSGPSAMHSLAVGAQGVASGVKDIVLAPVEIMAGLQNAITAGINKVAGTNIPMATPASKIVERISADAQEGLAQARAKLKATQEQIDNSAVGTLLHEDPRDVANGLLSGKYSSESKLDEILALVKNDAPAKRGWKAAVAEVLADRVQGSRQVGETPEVQFARLSKEFKDNETLLAKTFSPDEMNSLRQGHKLLSYFKEAEKRGTVGSDTADKWNIPTWAQLAVRHVKGDLAGGGLIKRFKLLLEQLPTNRQSADEIVQMA